MDEISWITILALIPAIGVTVYLMGVHSLQIFLVSVFSAIITEAGIQRVTSKRIRVTDGSAVVTGLILALLLPNSVPLWVPAFGAVFAIGIVKEAFGGHGYNIFNPALGGWVFITMSWGMYTVSTPSISTGLFLNEAATKLGEVSPALLFIGGIYLLVRGHANWEALFGFVFTTLLAAFFFGVEYYLTGLFVLFAFFIITDPITTPSVGGGRMIFGIGCAILTALYSFYGNFEEGLALSVLLMNSLTPWIDRLTKMTVGETRV